MIKNIVLTSDHHSWLLRGFMHQWQKYDGSPITIFGFKQPDFPLDGDPEFVSLGDMREYPVERWSNALIKILQEHVGDECFALYLEDYWLTRKTNQFAVDVAERLVRFGDRVLRFDLTTDRLYCGDAWDVFSVDSIDVMEASPHAAYSLSFQTAVWKKDLMLEVLVPNENPWQTEMQGTHRIDQANRASEGYYRIYGTRQFPVRYQIVVNKGEFDRAGKWMSPPRSLTTHDWQELDDLGYTLPL